ncbi:hypothetical protein CY34DRAFT_16461 [Suillus luteus UH-Slu-Lm8-n1]|uniref:Uncharacterized protein n=1 Tax=Suillus luteus UH-Slu-Lm8-n1 TaxID=930992 RepID=A0A0D0A3Q8_9AGAM|nr:hypothetical protein CY34DRAFT_16461 [Suillus luteus UH-Slu-Lm8-n1]
MAYNNHNADLVLPAGMIQVPGPLIISENAIPQDLWNAAIETAHNRIQSHSAAPPVPVQTTVEDKCWLTLMALRREQELQETARYLENARQELSEAKKLLGIAT